MKDKDIQKHIKETIENIAKDGLGGILVISDNEDIRIGSCNPQFFVNDSRGMLLMALASRALLEATPEEIEQMLGIVNPIAGRLVDETGRSMEKQSKINADNGCGCPACQARRLREKHDPELIDPKPH